MTPVVTLTDAPSAAAKAAIEDGLGRYNAEQAGYSHSRPLAVVVGGALGRTSLGLLFIDLFFLPDDLRRHRLGRVFMVKDLA